jgi:3-dehydroquinate synthase
MTWHSSYDRRAFAMTGKQLHLFKQLNVKLTTCTYPIYIGNNLFSDKELLKRHVLAEQVLIVTNETIAPLYLEQIKGAFSHLQLDVLILKDGEHYKNQHSLLTIYDELIKHQHHRDTTIIALGGGVVGDLTGFAAATYQRGVRFIQLPTSLLAQVDASIGGKTAINYLNAKNMIGSFYQPQAVIIDINTLLTLPPREFNAGFAEVIKYGLLVGGDFLVRLTQIIDKGISPKISTELTQLIWDCCRIKANIVQSDEKEHGVRALLNLGHTFAHALEAISNYDRWLHGEAVSIGLYCAALLSHQLGSLKYEAVEQIDALLEKGSLPRRIPADIDLQVLQALMQHDKKIKNKQLRFVLMKDFGQCYIDSHVSEDSLHQVLILAVKGDCL